MGNFYMEATQINYRRDDKPKTVDQKLKELSETSAIDTDIAPVFKSTNTYQPGDMVYYSNKLYVFNVEHTGTWAAADVTATDVTTEISSLKSGLTNYEAKIDAALDVPENTGKNLLPLIFNDIKSNNTNGTWSGNAFTRNGITFTLVYENNTIVGVNINGTATAETSFVLFNSPSNPIQSGDYIGSIDVYDGAKFWVDVYDASWGHRKVIFTSTTFDDQEIGIARLVVADGYNANDVTIHIMIRPATITDPTFAPYIPSVESRIEAVESGLTNITNVLTISQNSNISNLKEGMNAVLITTGFVIGESPVTPVTLSNNFRGYIVRNGSNLVGMISNYDSTVIYHISSTTITAISYYKDLS